MDVDDLRSELARRAEQMPAELGTAARMAAVRRRVRARRQRLAGGVAAAVLGVGVVALLPSVVDRDAAQVVEPATPTQTPSEETPGREALDLGSWPTRIDGNTFLAGRVSNSDPRTATWKMTVPRLDVSVALVCRFDAQQFPGASRDGTLIAHFKINGHGVYGSSCGTSESLDSARPIADISGQVMRNMGVRPGKPFRVEMVLEHDGKAVPVSKAVLGLGLYAQDGEVRQVAPGWSIPVIQGVPGDETRLYEVYTSPVGRSGKVVTVTTQPSTSVGSTLSYGWLVRGRQGSFEIVVDGKTVERSTAGALSSGTPIRGKHELVLRTRGGVDQGTLVLALYEPVDLPYTGSARR